MTLTSNLHFVFSPAVSHPYHVLVRPLNVGNRPATHSDAKMRPERGCHVWVLLGVLVYRAAAQRRMTILHHQTSNKSTLARIHPWPCISNFLTFELQARPSNALSKVCPCSRQCCTKLRPDVPASCDEDIGLVSSQVLFQQLYFQAQKWIGLATKRSDRHVLTLDTLPDHLGTWRASVAAETTSNVDSTWRKWR